MFGAYTLTASGDRLDWYLHDIPPSNVIAMLDNRLEFLREKQSRLRKKNRIRKIKKEVRSLTMLRNAIENEMRHRKGTGVGMEIEIKFEFGSRRKDGGRPITMGTDCSCSIDFLVE